MDEKPNNNLKESAAQHPAIQAAKARVAQTLRGPINPATAADAALELVLNVVTHALELKGGIAGLVAGGVRAVEPIVEGAIDKLAGGTGTPAKDDVAAVLGQLQGAFEAVMSLVQQLAQKPGPGGIPPKPTY